jgi:hypothetical protein
MSSAIIEDFVSEEPPTVKGSGDLCEQQGPLASGAASSAAQTIAHVPAMGECFVTFTISGNAARFNFGSTSSVTAADANSALLPAGKHRLRITAATQFFKVIQETGAASISWWRSSK